MIAATDGAAIFAVLRGITPGEISAIAETLTAEGFRLLEVPLNSPKPFDSIRLLADGHGDRCLVGAGTVIDPADVARVHDAGGHLIVMPHADSQAMQHHLDEIALLGFRAFDPPPAAPLPAGVSTASSTGTDPRRAARSAS